jgi:hypothetical protein
MSLLKTIAKHLALLLVPLIYLALSDIAFYHSLNLPSQKQRLYFLPPFLLFSVLSFQASKYFWFIPGLGSLWCLAVSLKILHTISVLHIEKWPVPQLPPGKALTRKQKFVWHFRAAYRIWGNPQMLRTIASKEDEKKPKETQQSLSVFLFLRLIKLPIYYYIHFRILPAAFAETLVEYIPQDLSSEEQILIRRLFYVYSEVTARELVVRAYMAVYWIWESLVYLDGANSILACFFVLVGLDEPRDWPSLFGNPTAITGLRTFWSRFWHRVAVRPYSNYGKVVARFLGLGDKSIGCKTVVAFVVFALSGISHSAVSWQLGQKEWWLDVWWFLMNFLGCTGEVVFLGCVRSLAKKIGWSRELTLIEESWFGRFVGYAWVLAFFFWSVPKWKYPAMYQTAVVKARWNEIWSKMRVA